jgi:hypothetical protein
MDFDALGKRVNILRVKARQFKPGGNSSVALMEALTIIDELWLSAAEGAQNKRNSDNYRRAYEERTVEMDKITKELSVLRERRFDVLEFNRSCDKLYKILKIPAPFKITQGADVPKFIDFVYTLIKRADEPEVP